MDDFLDGTNAPTMKHRINFTPQGSAKYYYIHNIEQIEGRESFLKIITEEKD
jgi:hypothetical protein